jgi:hypothetical protein
MSGSSTSDGKATLEPDFGVGACFFGGDAFSFGVTWTFTMSDPDLDLFFSLLSEKEFGFSMIFSQT